MPTSPSSQFRLLNDIRALIESGRAHVAKTVNTGLTLIYWNVGRRIRQEILKDRRAEYGKRILLKLSVKLVPEYGEGFTEKNLRHMIRFHEAFPDIQIVSTLWRQLGWSHFKLLIYMEDALKRDFYAEMCGSKNGMSARYRRRSDPCFSSVQPFPGNPQD